MSVKYITGDYMKVVAITGGIGSGKSLVLDAFEKLGADVISADAVSHKIMLKGEAAYAEVVAAFGKDILDENMEIDRKKLGTIVFSDKEKLELLNSISHRIIYKKLLEFVKSSDKQVVCLEIPLLFSAKCPIDLDMIIGVSADKEIRISRVIKRDNCTYEQALARMRNQVSDEEIQRLSDCVIFNNGNINEVYNKVEEIYRSLSC